MGTDLYSRDIEGVYLGRSEVEYGPFTDKETGQVVHGFKRHLYLDLGDRNITALKVRSEELFAAADSLPERAVVVASVALNTREPHVSALKAIK